MSDAVYYRLIWQPELHAAWDKDPVPNSTHNFYPSDWKDVWDSGEREPNSFPLAAKVMGIETVFHDNARKAFLEIATEKKLADFTQQETARCSELDGVCAFVHPKGAYNYAVEHDDPSIRIVVFEGEYVCVCHEGANSDDPEMKSHVVRVKKKLFRRVVPQFAQQYLNDSGGDQLLNDIQTKDGTSNC